MTLSIIYQRRDCALQLPTKIPLQQRSSVKSEAIQLDLRDLERLAASPWTAAFAVEWPFVAVSLTRGRRASAEVGSEPQRVP